MREIQDVAVRELMPAPAVAVRPATRIEELTRLMSAHDDDAFPVGGPLPGLVAQLDLFKHQAAVIVFTYGDRMIAGFDRV